MRILYVSRLFSGLAEGLRDRRWDPRGVPTVYRLLEALDKTEHDLRVVFTVKDDAVDWPSRKTCTFPSTPHRFRHCLTSSRNSTMP